MDWSPLILTFKLSLITTILLFFVGIPVAYWLAYTKTRVKPIFETIIALPLVLPPTVLGFYLLITFSPNSGLGAWLNETLGWQVLFSFGGLVFASMIYSLPFMVRALQSGFEKIPKSLIEASDVLGKSRWQTLRNVLLPNMKPAILTGLILSFAHTIGEFGVVLMIGGNIQEETRVASIAIYDEGEALNYGAAHNYSFILLFITFSILLCVFLVNGNYLNRSRK